MTEHPYLRLDETVHQRVRLGILSVLAVGRTSFTELRDALAQPDGSLSRHLGVLAEAGLVTIEKTFQDRKPRTLVSITPRGRESLRDEFTTVSDVAAFAGHQAPTPGPAHTTFSMEAQWRPFVLNAVPAGFSLSWEFPIAGGDRAGGVVHPDFGIRGGYNRRWVRDGAGVEILFLELEDPSAPVAVVSGLGNTADVPDFPAARAREEQSEARIWFGRDRFLVSVSVTGPDAGELARDVAMRQHETMDSLLGTRSATPSTVTGRLSPERSRQPGR